MRQHSIGLRIASRVARTVLHASLLALVVCAGTAIAIGPPTAYTGEATQLTSSSAVLKGAIGPGNQQASYYFEYGASTAYGTQTLPVPGAAGNQTVHVTASIAGLSAYAVYHYRLVVTNASATVFGQDRLFTTRKVPLTVTLAQSNGRELFGDPFVVSGTLAGTGSAGHAVVLEANPFPYLSGFKSVGSPVTTDTAGGFSFLVSALSQTSRLRVATVDLPPVTSRALLEAVAVRVTLHVRPVHRPGFVRLYGTVSPAQPRTKVRFDVLREGHRAVTVGAATTRLSGSRFSCVVRRYRNALYRAFVEISHGAWVSNHSRAIRIGGSR